MDKDSVIRLLSDVVRPPQSPPVPPARAHPNLRVIVIDGGSPRHVVAAIRALTHTDTAAG